MVVSDDRVGDNSTHGGDSDGGGGSHDDDDGGGGGSHDDGGSNNVVGGDGDGFGSHDCDNDDGGGDGSVTAGGCTSQARATQQYLCVLRRPSTTPTTFTTTPVPLTYFQTLFSPSPRPIR